MPHCSIGPPFFTVDGSGRWTLVLYMHVTKLAKILIEGGDRDALRYGGSGNQTVDEMSPRCLIALECIQVDNHFTDLDTGTRDEAAQCRGDIGTGMPIKRLKDEHAFR